MYLGCAQFADQPCFKFWSPFCIRDCQCIKSTDISKAIIDRFVLVDRKSTGCRPNVDRKSTGFRRDVDRMSSTECLRPDVVDQVLNDYSKMSIIVYLFIDVNFQVGDNVS